MLDDMDTHGIVRDRRKITASLRRSDDWYCHRMIVRNLTGNAFEGGSTFSARIGTAVTLTFPDRGKHRRLAGRKP